MSKARRDFAIGLIGLQEVEKSIVKSVLNMANSIQTRVRSYNIIDETKLNDAEILMVNPSTGRHLITLMKINSKEIKKPVIYLANQFNKTLDSTEHVISRSRLSSKLLNLLDKISVDNLNYAPDLMIGNRSSMSTGLIQGIDNKKAINEPATVLVIDDSMSIRTQMKLGLKLHNINSDFAENAIEGLELAKRNQYRLIFLDVVMPGMDGYKACKIIKSDPDTKNTPVILLTSRNSPFDKVRGVMSGCDKYLNKPIHAMQLEEVLREYGSAPVDKASSN